MAPSSRRDSDLGMSGHGHRPSGPGDGPHADVLARPRKSSAGYNLTALFVGSEGTLGIVTEITLKLAVVPQETSIAVVTFPSVRAAAAAASQVIRAGVPVGAVELMDEIAMQVVNRSGATPRKWQEVPTLFFKSVQPWSIL